MRTEEQKAADEALTAAIEACGKAYEVIGEHDMMQEYAVVVALQSWNHEDDSANYSYTMLVRDGGDAGTRIVGLLEVASCDVKSGRED